MPGNTKKNLYPPMILLLISGFIIFLVWSAFKAAGLGSKVTDKDYYSKGLKYNATSVEKKAAEVLGWNLKTQLTGNILTFSLTDKNGEIVGNATGKLYLAVPESAENIHLPLKEVTPGTYYVSFDDKIKGAILARLELERKGARLNKQFLLNLE